MVLANEKFHSTVFCLDKHTYSVTSTFCWLWLVEPIASTLMQKTAIRAWSPLWSCT